MTSKRKVFLLSVAMIAGLGFFGVPVDNTFDLKIPGWLPLATNISTVKIQLPYWLTQQEAVASPYRRSVRRTARRTSRRTSRRTARRHAIARGGYYGSPRYYGGAAIATGAVVGTAMLATGTIVRSLPPACSTILVNGITYYNCSGTYYAPSGHEWIVVTPP
jgi:hypothetical protein